MSFFYIDPDTYRRYRDEVIALSDSIQVNYPEHLPPEKRQPPLSDQQIGERLGLDARTVAEIRCVAEREYYGIEEWQRAIEFKDRACRGYARSGLGFTTGKYFEQRKQSRGAGNSEAEPES